MKQKVLAYIFRTHQNKRQILVFDHVAYPEVSPQVIGGSVDENESTIDAVLREIFEESGLKLEHAKRLGEFEFFKEESQELQNRNVFTFEATSLPDSWTHVVSAGDEDKGLEFFFYWMHIADAKIKLKSEMGKYLSMDTLKSATSMKKMKEFEEIFERTESSPGGWFSLTRTSTSIEETLSLYETPTPKPIKIPTADVLRIIEEKMALFNTFGQGESIPNGHKDAFLALQTFVEQNTIDAVYALGDTEQEWFIFRAPWSDQLNFDFLLETQRNIFVFHCGWSS